MEDLFTLESLESAGIVPQDKTEEVVQTTNTTKVVEENGNPPLEDNKGEVLNTEVEKSTPEESDTDEPITSSGDFSETLIPFANFLSEKGFISLKDDEGKDVEFKSFEDLAEKMKSEIDKNRYGDMNDAQRRYFEALEHGIPLSEVEELNREFSVYNSYTEEILTQDKHLRFNIIYNDQLEKGYSEEEANSLANIIIKDDKLSMNSAIKFLDNKKKDVMDRYKSLKDSTVEKNKVDIETLTSTINKKEDFLGVPFTEDFRKKVTKSMTTRAGQSKEGVPLNAFDKWRAEKGPEAEVILHALMLYTDNFSQMSRVEQRVKSTAVADLENTLRKSTNTQFKNKNSTTIKVGNDEFTLL